MLPGWARAALLGIALALVGNVAPAPAATDPALEALRSGDAYVSQRVLGEASGEARELLASVAAELTASGRPAKLAIVAGPTGAPSMRVYARRLRDELGYDGFLVVTAPRRVAMVVGPRAPAEITRDLRAGKVGSVVNPVDRVIAAARLGTGEPPPSDDGGWRAMLAIIGLGLVGGTWAAAWGLRRERRHQRTALLDARARALVQLDALAARADELGERPDLPPAAAPPLERAVAAARAAQAELEQAREASDVDRALPGLRAGLQAVADAAALAGQPMGDDPFAGLCRVDPAHGPATATGAAADDPGPLPLCADCAARAARGEPASRRMVPVGGHPVPFDEAGLGTGEPGRE